MKKLFVCPLLLLAMLVFAGTANAESYRIIQKESLDRYAMNAQQGSFANIFTDLTWNTATMHTVRFENGSTMRAFGLNPADESPVLYSRTNYTAKDATAAIGADKLSFITDIISYGAHMLQNTNDTRYYTLVQFCIWETMFDGVEGFGDIVSGKFGVLSSISKWYGQQMAALKDNLATTLYDKLIIEYSLLSSTASWFDKPQDLLAFNITGKVPATPAPAAIWLLGSGLAGIMVLRRKRA